MSARILDQKVAIIEYIMYTDTREATVLRSAQRSMLKHLFPILKMFVATASEVSAETAPWSQVILLGHRLKKKAAYAIPKFSWSQGYHTSLLMGKFSYQWKGLLFEEKESRKGNILVYKNFQLWKKRQGSQKIQEMNLRTGVFERNNVNCIPSGWKEPELQPLEWLRKLS